ncbi:hypothetical protein DFH08DRAFT_828102 [Mycena albidolilacea]|uniref:Uncharacterized protein n=1 Tax=Mycena albidolilacea TaxID=1033008 RepID=A0AAD7E6F4_9AGAR|nr:hypothetical protein DFH08DRAFT_828102 [Mycena albidolilacea]
MDCEAGREEQTYEIEPQGHAHGLGVPAGRSRSAGDCGGENRGRGKGRGRGATVPRESAAGQTEVVEEGVEEAPPWQQSTSRRFQCLPELTTVVVVVIVEEPNIGREQLEGEDSEEERTTVAWGRAK